MTFPFSKLSPKLQSFVRNLRNLYDGRYFILVRVCDGEAYSATHCHQRDVDDYVQDKNVSCRVVNFHA